MEVIQKAKIVAIDFDQARNSYLVTLDNGERYRLSKKALWSWGRIQDGRKSFDVRVKDRKGELLAELTAEGRDISKRDEIQASRKAAVDVFGEVWPVHKDKQRVFQAIVKKDVLISVATFKHVLLDPEVVRRIGDKVFSSLDIEPWDKHSHMWLPNQILGTYKKVEDMKLGINFSAGDIYTTYAIYIGQWIELLVCTNPIQWLRGMLSTYLMGTKIGWKARILRLQKVLDEKVLEARITQLVKDVQGNERGLLATMKASKTKLITPEMAEVMLKAFSSSYGIGSKIQTEALEEFKEANGKSLYDLAQATSMISWSSVKFRQDASHARARLSAIAAVLTVIKDPKETYELCKTRLAERK